MECTFFRSFECKSCGSKQFDPPWMESDGFDWVSHLIDTVLAEEIRRMGEIVRKASTGVRGHGRRATVLSKIASAKEEGSDYPGTMVPGQRVDSKEAWDVWDEEEADREGFLQVTNRSSQRTVVESLRRWRGRQQ